MGNELFSVVGGKKVDADIHAPILDAAGPDTASLELRVKEAVADGYTEEQARELYGLTGGTASAAA